MMKSLKIILILAVAVIGFNLAGCKPQEKAVPEVQKAEAVKTPKLLIARPETTDSAAATKTPESVAADPHQAFYIQPVPDTEPPHERAGAKFDRAVQIGGQTLDLIGTTVRKFEMSSISLITIYTVGFYAPLGEDFATDIPDVAMALVLEYHLDVPKEKVITAIRENVDTNPKVDGKKLEPLFIQLSDAFDSPKKGDRYEFVYIPGQGTAMIKSGKVMTMISSREFQQAFFGIWLSPHGKDLDMRCELLALPCPPKSMLNPVNAISSGLGNAKEKLGKLKGLIP